MAAKGSYTLQNQRNRKKNRLQSTQEMVNAVDKVSVSLRRAFNINRCQQDNLDNEVWTLERECRKSLGLLSLEQRKFIRSLKPPVTRLNTDGETRKILKHSTTIDKLAKRNGLKTWRHLPSLVNGCKFHRSSYQDRFKGSQDCQTLTKQNLSEKVHLPSITAGTKPNKVGRCKGKKTTERRMVNLDTSCESEDKEEWTEKINEDASHSFNVNKEHVDRKLIDHSRIEDENLNKFPKLSACDKVTKDSLEHDDGAKKLQQHTSAIIKNTLNSSARHNVPTENIQDYSLLAPRKIGLICETHPNICNYADKNTEIRVKEFLKLPPIVGLRESPAELNDQSGQDVEQLQEEWKRKFGRVNPQDLSAEVKDKLSLWKNLVHCRYLRVEDQILPKTCQCNWCTMMKKYEM